MQEAYSSVLAQTPRIALASLMAFLCGSFLNAYVMSKMKIMHRGKHFGLRAIASTIVGELADTFIFTTVGFLFVIPLQAVVMIILTETVLKTLFEIIILPLTTKVVRQVKEREGVDVYDDNISYNVLRIKEI